MERQKGKKEFFKTYVLDLDFLSQHTSFDFCTNLLALQHYKGQIEKAIQKQYIHSSYLPFGVPSIHTISRVSISEMYIKLRDHSLKLYVGCDIDYEDESEEDFNQRCHSNRIDVRNQASKTLELVNQLDGAGDVEFYQGIFEEILTSCLVKQPLINLGDK